MTMQQCMLDTYPDTFPGTRDLLIPLPIVDQVLTVKASHAHSASCNEQSQAGKGD